MGKRGIYKEPGKGIPDYERQRMKRAAYNISRIEEAGSSKRSQQEDEDMEVDQFLGKKKNLNRKDSRCSQDKNMTMADFIKSRSQKQSSKDALAGGKKKQQPQQKVIPGSVGSFRNMRIMQGNQQNSLAAESHVHMSSFQEEDTSINQDEVVENAASMEAPLKNKHRGRSILAKLHDQIAKGRIEIVLNDRNQVVGEPQVVADFTHFLGLVAKDPILAPLDYPSWKHIPTKDIIWEYVMKFFNINEDGRKFVMQTINANWRLYKYRVKNETYMKFGTMAERLANRRPEIPKKQYKELLEYWDSDYAKETSKKNKENVKNRSDYHTMGPISFAMKRHLMREERPDITFPSQAELYIESRKRADGRTYKTNPEPSQRNIAKIKDMESLPDRMGKGDPYHDVFTEKEHNGRLRLHGRAVTKTSLKETEGRPPYILPSKYMESIEKHLEQKITSKILSQLKAIYPGIDIPCPNFTTTSKDADQAGEPHGASRVNEEDFTSDEILFIF